MSKIKEITFRSTRSRYANFFGRNDASADGVNIYYGTAGFEVQFYGTKLEAELRNLGINGSYTPQIQILVDGERVPRRDSEGRKLVIDDESFKRYTLIDGLPEGVHTLKALKRTAFVRIGEIMDAFAVKKVITDGYFKAKPKLPSLKIEIYGDSISAGYGNLTDGKTMTSENTNGLLTYHYIANEILNASANVQGHSGWGIYIRSDGRTEQSSTWYNHFDKVEFQKTKTWNFDKYQPQIVLLNLGTNDSRGLDSGVYKSAEFIAYYKKMVQGIRAHYPNAKFLLSYGMMGTNATVWADIQQTQRELQEEFGAEVVYAYRYQDYRGGEGHPRVGAHIQNGEDLASFIQNNLL